MALFTTLVVLDSEQRGHFIKATFPFSPVGEKHEEIIRQVLFYMPNVFVIIIPGAGIYDVKKKAYRQTVDPVDWWQVIADYERIVSETPKDIEFKFQPL